jgi:predicted ArsR family transcriptional regulator
VLSVDLRLRAGGQLERRHVAVADLLHRQRQAGPLRTDDLARRVNARHWTDLCTALDELVSGGYVTVVGPLGRPETLYRVRPRGRAALIEP